MYPTCDLCDRVSTTDDHCSECGHELDRVDVEAVPRATANPRVELTPFAAVAAPLRAEHRADLRALAEWALAHGRPHDVDSAAFCIDVLDRFRSDGVLVLNRRDVNHLISCDLRNRSSMERTLLPDELMRDVWTVVRFLHDTGRLGPDSDPLGPLLEPMQCYGGLDDDGEPRPDGVDIDYACQCYLPYDPGCPPGLAQRIVGTSYQDDEFFEFVVHADLVARSADVPFSSYKPLIRLSRRLRATNSVFDLDIDEFDHLGRVPADGNVPELWLYSLAPVRRRGFDALALDEHGHGWRAKRHWGRKRGFRWMSVSDREAIGWCGLASHQPRWGRDERLDAEWREEEDVQLRVVSGDEESAFAPAPGE
jgi:hypothetical protein